MTGRYPRPGWSHRQPMILRDVLVVGTSLAIIALTELRLYGAVVGLLALATAVVISAWLVMRPSPQHVDAWRRNHRNRVGDRW